MRIRIQQLMSLIHSKQFADHSNWHTSAARANDDAVVEQKKNVEQNQNDGPTKASLSIVSIAMV